MAGSTDTPHTRFALIAAAIFVMAYAIAGYFASLGIVPWLDEVQFIDPGATLYLAGKFESSVWPYQRFDELFLSNAPAYSFLSGLWFHLVGFGAVQARALSWLLGLVALVLMVRALVTTRILTLGAAAAVAALFITGYGVNVSFWNARYDTLGMCAMALIVAGLLGPPERHAVSWSGRVALVLVPFIGFQLAVLSGLVIVLEFIFRRSWRRSLDALISLGAGGAILLATAAMSVGLVRFLIMIVGSAHTVLGQAVRGDGVLAKLRTLPQIWYQDPNYVVAVLVCAALLAWQWSRVRSLHRLDLLLLGAALVLPLVMFAIGKYPIYYSWMAWSIVCVLLVRLIGAMLAPAAAGYFLAGLIGASAVLGGGMFVWRFYDAAFYAGGEPVLAEIRAAVPEGPSVFADYSAYFALRDKVRFVFTDSYAQTSLLPDFPTDTPITTAVVGAGKWEAVRALLGGEGWQRVYAAPEAITKAQDPLEVWVRP